MAGLGATGRPLSGIGLFAKQYLREFGEIFVERLFL